MASYRKDNGGGVATISIGEYGDPFAVNHFGKGLYPTSFPLTPYDGSLLSGVQRSVTPPPPSLDPRMMDGTERTDSIFSTDDQSSLTGALPNFPRIQLKVCVHPLHALSLSLPLPPFLSLPFFLHQLWLENVHTHTH